MDDDVGLELSLGLACGRSSSPSKDTSDISADGRTDTDERTNKILNDFRRFLNAGIPQLLQPTYPENFHLQQAVSRGNDSVNETGTCGKKRKSTYDGTKNNSKRQEAESYSSVVQGTEKNSHISVTTEEGSTEDTADDGSRTVDGKLSISATSFPVQKMNISGVPYSMITTEESSSASATSMPLYPLATQGFPPANGGQSIPRVTSTESLPLSFTYSSEKIPNKDSPWGRARSRLLHSSYAGSSITTSVSMQLTDLTSSEPTQPDVHRLDQLRGPPKPVPWEASSSQPQGETEAGIISCFSSKYPAIVPGIAAELSIGGSGSFSNLPWVSTTGSGPNGKTISGVAYKYNTTEIKIVCACHGLHLSPEEFLRHANEDRPSAVTSYEAMS